jgi:hypothetical protein
MFRSAGARNPFGGRAFYKHLAPNGAKTNSVLLHFQLESAICHLPFGGRDVHRVTRHEAAR